VNRLPTGEERWGVSRDASITAIQRPRPIGRAFTPLRPPRHLRTPPPGADPTGRGPVRGKTNDGRRDGVDERGLHPSGRSQRRDVMPRKITYYGSGIDLVNDAGVKTDPKSEMMLPNGATSAESASAAHRAAKTVPNAGSNAPSTGIPWFGAGVRGPAPDSLRGEPGSRAAVHARTAMRDGVTRPRADRQRTRALTQRRWLAVECNQVHERNQELLKTLRKGPRTFDA